MVDRLAANGYVAIVPDLLASKHGRTPPNADSARKLIGELEPDRVTADLDATYAWVAKQPATAADRIGVIGFCWGGGQTFRYATNNPKLRAAVVCYGPTPDPGADPRRLWRG
jgi:carboxymethylenebutenolidase